MPSKGLKTLVNLEDEALAMASIKTINANETKKTKKLITKELSTSSSSSLSSSTATTTATTTATSTSQTTSTKMAKTKEKLVKYKKSKSTTIENSSIEKTTELLEEKQVKKIEEQQNISAKMENVSSEKFAIEKLPTNSSKIFSSTSASAASSSTSTDQNISCQVSNENIKEETENATNDKMIKTKMANGKKSLKVKTTKKHELMKQQQQQQQQRDELMQQQEQQHQQQQQQQNGQREQTICKKCQKPVYKMEEVKAEKQIFHKNCFRCNQCDKQLKVDNYQSHEGILYCVVHFKLLFAPKYVEDDVPKVPQKPELIIRENQPAELPPDVVRACEKPDLGLEELHQLNLRSRFQLFEKDNNSNGSGMEVNKTDGNVTVKRSATILAKMSKLTQQKYGEHHSQRDSDEEGDKNDQEDNRNSDDSCSDDNLIISNEKYRQMQREQPLGLGDAMNDIRTRFENGPGLLKEERREERKQEIQNIRSRLFMGKQARIKEMYQQAVAQSSQGVKQSNPKQLDIQLEIDAQRLKERFERGEFNNNDNSSDETNNNLDNQQHERKSNTLAQEAEVFEYGISKASRSIFMEIDANVKATNQTGTQLNIPKKYSNSTTNIMSYYKTNGEQEDVQRSTDVVKCNENTEDIVIKTSEISEKFKFFEKYQPVEEKRREFRITPPREGVVKMPTPEQESDNNAAESKERESSPGLLRSNTTTIMLSKFRQLEKQNYKLSHRHNNDDDDDYDDDDDSDDYMVEPKPLKRFTPPPAGEKQYYTNQESDCDVDGSNENDDDDENRIDENYAAYKDDEALREARAAARAKQLRLKFEKWQSNEMTQQSQMGSIDVYSSQVSDDTTIESAKVLRERFENMNNTDIQQHSSRPRYQVKRFV